jgi:hypothetical protein
MTEHQDQAARLEREAEEMEKRSERLGGEISDARQDWDNKVRDESVPGTPPPPESGLPPEANYTTSGDNPPDNPDDEREPWADE